MKHIHTATFILLGLFIVAITAPRAQAQMVPPSHAMTSPVVLELFTSQSCSSCPPADKVLAQFAEQLQVIALGCHVTYWDHLAWKDKFSLQACTDRQSRYAAAAGRQRVFTPEMIVNGRRSINGADEDGITKLVMKNAHRIERIDISQTDEGFVIDIPAVDAGHTMLTLAVIGRDATTDIKRGENAGRSIGYVRPVLGLKAMGVMETTTARQIRISRKDIPEAAQGFALLLQRGKDGAGYMVAAGQFIFVDNE